MPVRRLTQGLLRPESLETPVRGTQLVLDDSLFEDDALVFDRPASRRVAYSAADSAIRIDIGFDDFPQLGIWSKPGAGFVCIEPWRGHASPESFAGELSDKPGIVCLEAGGEMSLSYTIGVSST
jgi:galactose mutarotase-like enzyme